MPSDKTNRDRRAASSVIPEAWLASLSSASRDRKGRRIDVHDNEGSGAPRG
jgi:hypothetical protein